MHSIKLLIGTSMVPSILPSIYHLGTATNVPYLKPSPSLE